MKTFEEKFTAWLDGLLAGEELRSFETEYPSLQQEKAEFLKLKSLLKESLPSRELENPEFFNSQLMERDQAGDKCNEQKLSAFVVWFASPRVGRHLRLGYWFCAIFHDDPPRAIFLIPAPSMWLKF